MASNSTRQFLVRCLRAFLAAERTPPPGTPIEEVDWTSLVQLAAFHRVAPLLYKSLRNTCPQGVPVSVLSDLEAYVRSASSRGLLLTGELLRLLKRWDAAGVPAIPFKGPALAVRLYGDPALRHFDDLDVLVRAEEFPAAREAILALGYRPSNLHSYSETFIQTRSGIEITLDLHWHFLIKPTIFPFAPFLESVFVRSELFSMSGYKARTFSNEDLLLFLCVHGSKHLWLRLQWLCDVAQLLYTHPDLDWTQVMAQANSSGGRGLLYLGLYLSNDLLGAPLPSDIEQAVRRDRTTVHLARRVKRQLSEEPLDNNKPWNESSVALQFIDRPTDRLTYFPRLWWHKFRSSAFAKSRTSLTQGA